jgi:hypothetical protein
MHTKLTFRDSVCEKATRKPGEYGSTNDGLLTTLGPQASSNIYVHQRKALY